MFFPFMSWCQGKEDIFKELIDKFWLTYMVILETFRNLEIRFREIFFGQVIIIIFILGELLLVAKISQINPE